MKDSKKKTEGTTKKDTASKKDGEESKEEVSEKKEEEVKKDDEVTKEEEVKKDDEVKEEEVKKQVEPVEKEEEDEDVDKAASSNGADSDSDQLIEIEDPDDYLLYLEQILVKIHSRFYDIYERSKEIADLKVLVPKIRSEILVGHHLVFSGLVPNHVKLEQSKAYLIARGMGATVTQNFEPNTTHLVAANAGTIKAIAARKKANIKIVTPDWLWCCAERWEHVDERLYPLDPNKPSKMRQPPPHTLHSPEHGGGADKGFNSDDESGAGCSKMPFHDNPLLSFTHTELAEMNKDFDEFFEESSDSSSSEEDDEPVDMENPPMQKALRKRRRLEERDAKNAPRKAEPPIQLNFATNENSRVGQSSSSEDDSPSAKFRRGKEVRFHRPVRFTNPLSFSSGGDLPSDLDLGSNSADGSEEDKCEDGEWNMMGAALEREFLGLD